MTGRAFSLVELMMALGILTVGATMIASAFPVAMVENKASIEATTGTIVAENALAICRIRLSHSALNGIVDNSGWTDVSDRIDPGDRAYPTAPGPADENPAHWFEKGGQWYPNSMTGWLVAARQPVENSNSYDLAIVVYRKPKQKDRPGEELTLDLSTGDDVRLMWDGEEGEVELDPIAKWKVRVPIAP
jgi:prepilin-type N-terminal cleavage/methylation domain-containing protein